MKNLYITLFSILFISLSTNAQIVVFHPVKVPSEEIEDQIIEEVIDEIFDQNMEEGKIDSSC